MGVDFLGQLGLERILIEIGDVHQLARLVADRLDEFRVAVAERTHGDAHAEIQITLPRVVPQPRAGTSHGDQRKAAVGGQNVLRVEFGSRHGWRERGGP